MLYVNQYVNCSHTCSYSISRPSMSNTPKLSWFVWGTYWFDSMRTASIPTTGSQDRWNNDTWTFLFLKMWQQTSWFVWGTLQLDLICTKSCLTQNRLPEWRINNRGNDLCWFDWIKSNRQHFQPTLHSPPEVKIREIIIQEPSLFLKRCRKLQLIRMICVDLIKSSRIDNIFNPSYIVQGRYIFLVSRKSTSGETIYINSIESTSIDNIFNPPSKPTSAIFSRPRTRWVYWTTPVKTCNWHNF